MYHTLQCCYYRVRSKHRWRGMGDYQVNYHFYLATGVDAGLPFNTNDEAVDMITRRMAKKSRGMLEAYRRLRPPSCGRPLAKE